MWPSAKSSQGLVLDVINLINGLTTGAFKAVLRNIDSNKAACAAPPFNLLRSHGGRCASSWYIFAMMLTKMISKMIPPVEGFTLAKAATIVTRVNYIWLIRMRSLIVTLEIRCSFERARSASRMRAGDSHSISRPLSCRTTPETSLWGRRRIIVGVVRRQL